MIVRYLRYAGAVLNLLRRPQRLSLQPIHMQLEPTNRCNLDCPMCQRKSAFGRGSHMSYELFERVFRDVRPLHLTLSGIGETMMNRDIFRMVALAESHGARVNMTSNGNYLKRRYKEVIDSGLTLLSVSIDTVDREAYMRVRSQDLLEQTLEGLSLLQAEKKRRGVRGPALRLSSVMMEATLDHAHALVDKAVELEIGTLLFQPMALFGNWSNLAMMGRYADRQTYHEALVTLDRYARSRGVDTNLDQVFSDFRVVVQAYDKGVNTDNAFSKGCPFPWFSLYVRVDGKVLPCCVRGFANGFMGDLSRESMADIWNNPAYLDLRETFRKGEHLPYPECVGCAPPTLGEMLGKTRYTPGFMGIADR